MLAVHYQLLCDVSTDSSGDAVKAKASPVTMNSQRHGANCAAMSSFGDLAASRTLRRALASRRAGNSEPPPGPRHRYSTSSDPVGCVQTLLHHGQHRALHIRSQTGILPRLPRDVALPSKEGAEAQRCAVLAITLSVNVDRENRRGPLESHRRLHVSTALAPLSATAFNV